MNGRPQRAWPVMRSRTPSSMPPETRNGHSKTVTTPSSAPVAENKTQTAKKPEEKSIDREGASLEHGKNIPDSCPALLEQVLSSRRALMTLTDDEWLLLSSAISSLSRDEAIALSAILDSSINNLEGTHGLLGITCFLRLGLLHTSCWLSCCSQLESHWNKFLVKSDYLSRCQFLNIFIDVIGRLEIDDTWGLKVMADCLSLVGKIKDGSAKLVISLLSTLCRRSQIIVEQIYGEAFFSCEAYVPGWAPISWTTLFLVSDFYAILNSVPSHETPKSFEILQLVRPLELLASKLKEPSCGNDKGEKFLDFLVRDFKQVKECSAEWIALLCISKLLLSEFVRKPGPFLLRPEQLDAWSSLARIVRDCEERLGSCTLGTFMASDIKFIALARAPVSAAQALRLLFESLGTSMEAPMTVALSAMGTTSDRYFAVILRLLGDNSACMRVRAIRGLSRLIDSSDPMSKNQNFMKALSNRFEDQSPLVRDAALDFYFNLRNIDDPVSAELALSKLDDSSPLVRRRVIKVIESQMMNSAFDQSVFSELRAALINEVSVEGKTLADLSFNALLNSWLLPFFHKRSELLAKGEAISLRQAMANLAAEIIKTIRSPRTSIVAFQAFSTRIRESARGEEWSIICQEIVDLLFETLISSVESENDSAVKFVLAAIVVFATESIDCVSAHFKLICRLILSNEAETVEHSLSLLKGLLKEADLNMLRETPELAKDLCRLSFRGSNTIVRSAIECLGCLAIKDLNALERLRYLVTKHQSVVMYKENAPNPTGDLLRCRSLYSLSMLVNVICSNGIAIDISPDLVIDVLLYIPRTDPKAAVLCALSCAELFTIPFVAIKPSLVSVVKCILSEACAVAQISVLRGFLGLFANSGKGLAKSSFNSCENRPPDETSSLSATFQVYFSEFQRLILEGDAKLDEVLTSIFAAALSHGLVPPQTLIPHILCAWHPSNLRNQQTIAFQCVSVLQKFEPYLTLVLRPLFRLTYQYLCKAGSSYHLLFSSADGTTESYFHELFDSLSTKSRRIDFLTLLMQEIEAQSFASNYLVFLLVSVAQLPFKSEEELHLVLRRVDEQLAIGGDFSGSELSLPQQIRQLLILEVKSHLWISYRIQSRESACQGSSDSAPRRLKPDPLRLPDVTEIEKLSPCDLRKMFPSSLDLNAYQGIDSSDPTAIRRSASFKRQRAKRRKKAKVLDVSDEDETSVEEAY